MAGHLEDAEAHLDMASALLGEIGSMLLTVASRAEQAGSYLTLALAGVPGGTLADMQGVPHLIGEQATTLSTRAGQVVTEIEAALRVIELVREG